MTLAPPTLSSFAPFRPPLNQASNHYWTVQFKSTSKPSKPPSTLSFPFFLLESSPGFGGDEPNSPLPGCGLYMQTHIFSPGW